MITQLFVNPTEKTIRTNILKCLIEEQSIAEIKQLIVNLENSSFDLTKESFIFDEVEYGIARSK